MNQRFALPTRVDMAMIDSVSGRLKDFQEELNICYPGRQNVIKQLTYALCMREHMLMWGKTGTAKSALTGAFFNSITGATLFSTNLNKFSTESHVFGIPDPKVLMDTGVIHYRTEGMILPAHYAFLDEFLDASEPLLRTLLNLLNERTFNRGAQHEVANLLTAVATTNGNPYELVRANHSLEAVIDRFIFRCKVESLREGPDQVTMMSSYLNGLSPSITVSLADMQAYSGIVVSTNLITNPIYIAAYLSLINSFEREAGVEISDRSMAKLTQIMEASALLAGRLEIYPEDLSSIRFGICDGDNEEHHTIFDKLVAIEITNIEKKLNQSADAAQLQLIDKYNKELPPALLVTTPPAEILRIAIVIGKMEQDLKTMSCQLSTTEESRKRLLGSIEKRKAQINKLIYGGKQ